MAHVEDRWYRVVEGEKFATLRKGTGKRWRARWIDPSGRERSESFDRKVDADRRIAVAEGDKLRGTYIDHQAGRIRLRDFGVDWLASQTFDDNTRQAVEIRLRRHVYPYLGERYLCDLRPSHIQTWLRAVQQELAATTVKVTFSYLSSVLTAAVDDGRITVNPCKASSVRVARPDARKVVPWTYEQVEGVRRALPPRYRLALALPSGLRTAPRRDVRPGSRRHRLSRAGRQGSAPGQVGGQPSRLRPAEEAEDAGGAAARRAGARTLGLRRSIPRRGGHPALGAAGR